MDNAANFGAATPRMYPGIPGWFRPDAVEAPDTLPLRLIARRAAHAGRWLLLTVVLGSLLGPVLRAQWLEVKELQVSRGSSELAGPNFILSFVLPETGISESTPAYVFVRCSPDDGVTWRRLPAEFLRGDGFGAVSRGGRKTIIVWGATQTVTPDHERVRFRVRALPMTRVPAGGFEHMTIPGAGHDEAGLNRTVPELPLYHMATRETTVAMYVDFLNEMGGDGIGWDDRMTSVQTCGIVRSGTAPRFVYRVAPGRDNYPVANVSWYAAQAFLTWCGLQLPTEAEWEKAALGGYFLDGDATKRVPNPLPKRLFPWGDKLPIEGKTFRCNLDGPDDGYPFTAPVGSFPEDRSPYGILDLAGNVSEWTADWYTTSYHPGADGYRVIRGGSWTAFAEAVDAVTQPTMLPNKASGIVGFRGVLRDRP